MTDALALLGLLDLLDRRNRMRISLDFGTGLAFSSGREDPARQSVRSLPREGRARSSGRILTDQPTNGLGFRGARSLP